MTTITTDASHEDLLIALQDISFHEEATNQGVTITELSDTLGRPRKYIRRRMRQLINAGIVEVSMAPRVNMAGAKQRVPVYAIKKSGDSQT